MKRFAIAVYDNFYGTNEVHIVSANSAVEAIWEVYNSYGYFCEGEQMGENVDDVKIMFPDDIMASDPVEIE